MTPDNAQFAVAAYALASIVYFSYSAILVMRERALRKRLAELERTPG